MKRLYCLYFVIFLGGCATPTTNPWQGLDVDLIAAAEPIHCAMPRPDTIVGQSITYESASPLEAYRLCSEANEEMVSTHAKQIGQLKLSRKGLTEAGQAQRSIADMRQTMLEDERRHNFFEKIGLYVVIGVLGLAL